MSSMEWSREAGHIARRNISKTDETVLTWQPEGRRHGSALCLRCLQWCVRTETRKDQAKMETLGWVVVWADFKTYFLFLNHVCPVNGNCKNLRNIYVNSQVRKQSEALCCPLRPEAPPLLPLAQAP